MLNIALLRFSVMIHPERLPLYLGLALLMLILVTYLRVRTSPAYNQKPEQIVERRPGDPTSQPPYERASGSGSRLGLRFTEPSGL